MERQRIVSERSQSDDGRGRDLTLPERIVITIAVVVTVLVFPAAVNVGANAGVGLSVRQKYSVSDVRPTGSERLSDALNKGSVPVSFTAKSSDGAGRHESGVLEPDPGRGYTLYVHDAQSGRLVEYGHAR